MTAARILVVEDEHHIAAGLKLNLELDGFAVTVAESARDAGYQLLAPEGFDLILLDVMLPDIDGLTFCARLRDSGNLTPVLMLTANDRPEDRVAGLEAGADDYLGKPFDLDELRARVTSLLRRKRWSERPTPRAETVTRFGSVVVDFDAYAIEIEGRAAKMTRLEFDLLRYFVHNPRRVLSREELLEQVWQLSNHPNTRVVDNFIVRLRRHIEPNPRKPIHLLSVRGAGYQFVP
jgi:two-component system OmpR family response regulator